MYFLLCYLNHNNCLLSSLLCDKVNGGMGNKNSSVSVLISDPQVFNCYNCSQTLTIPISQCDNGHIVCSTCHSAFGNKCYNCSLLFKCCKAIENMLQSMKLPCPNEKQGCRELLSYLGMKKHEEFIHEPCWCPLLGCYFVASSKVLSNHFSHKHTDSQIKFSYGDVFVVSLKSTDKTIVLHEENYGKLFILSNNTMILGNAVNICCIGPNSSEFEDSYYIFTRSQKSKLKFQSLAKNIQQITLATLSSEFLVIPVGSSEPLKLEICITPLKIQIFIKGLDNWWHGLEVKSSETIGNVKEKIIDKLRIKIPVHKLYLLFKSQALDDRLTIANYNIQENSNLHLVSCLIGD